MVYSTGLINAKYPHLGASPGITVCDCHGKGLSETKCLHKYRNCLKGWQDDKDFPLVESGQIKKDHTCIMLWCKVNYSYLTWIFVIFSSGHH